MTTGVDMEIVAIILVMMSTLSYRSEDDRWTFIGLAIFLLLMLFFGESALFWGLL
ncbi:hypothetical protein HY641_01215 [Candidatus Woesearchaeota archaeon]|nr:hypothetical protein [Candidatus Woesearchaeota archaeon]